MNPNFENKPNKNIYEMSAEREELRQALREALKSGEQDIYQASGVAFSKLKGSQESDVDGMIEREGGISAVKEKLAKEKSEYRGDSVIDNDVIESEMGSEYVMFDETKNSVDALADKINKRLRLISINPDKIKRKAEQRIVEALIDRKTEQEGILNKIEAKFPRVARAHELVGYRLGLHEEGHIAMTPSVEEYIEEIETKMLTGKPMFLHGPTGTGKTSLARFAAQKLTGKNAEMVYCNQQTRESNIWGKQGIKVTEKGQPETVDILGPLARAISEGRPIIFDEFNSLEEDQMRMIKGIFGYEPGDDVPITGNGKIKMAPGFQMIMTANLKSEKHPDRRDLPDEMKREFEQNNLEIGYNPQDESFDIMLARLMNSDGSIDMSWHDLNITISKLAEVMNAIQNAYTNEISAEDAKSIQFTGAKKPNLKSFVMTHGSIESMIDMWNIEKQLGRQNQTFVEFIDERIKTALTFKAYTEEDRILAAKIFVSKGFLSTISAEQLGLPKDLFRGIKMDGVVKPEQFVAESKKVVHINLSELVDLDPFKKRASIVKPAEDFPENPELSSDKFSQSILDRLRKITGGNELLNSESISELLNANYDSQKEIIKNVGLLEKLSNGNEGIRAIDGQEYPFPTIDDVADRLSAKVELIERKLTQYENPMLMIVPLGLPLKSIRDAWRDAIIRHKAQLHNPDGTPVQTKNWVTNGTEFENNEAPVWVSDKYENADISGDLIYDPAKFEANHGGKTKNEILENINGYSILIIENTPNLPTDAGAKTLDGRKQLMSGMTPKEYLTVIKGDAQYEGESGLYTEEEIWYALSQLENENGLVVNNYSESGKVGFAVANYFKASGRVPYAYWHRDARQAVLGGGGPDYRYSDCSARASVKV